MRVRNRRAEAAAAAVVRSSSLQASIAIGRSNSPRGSNVPSKPRYAVAVFVDVEAVAARADARGTVGERLLTASSISTFARTRRDEIWDRSGPHR